MKLGEALAQLKRERSRLARLISLRKENVYVEKGKQSPFNPEQIGRDITGKIDQIRALKIRIQKTNLHAMLPKEKISLAEAIILVGDIRSKISHLSNLFTEKREYFSFRLRSKDDIEKIAQLSEPEVEKEIESLESEKIRIDNLIQIANWETELVN